MSHAGELLARLFPRGVNYMGVPGGVPELTPADIAGALGFVPKGLGRSIFEAVYWSDSDFLPSSELWDAVVGVVMPELSRQLSQLSEAQLDVQVALAMMRWSHRGPTVLQRQELARAQSRLDALKASAWPKKTLQRIPQIAKAIIAEMKESLKCEACGGRGVINKEESPVKCKKCQGSGIEIRTDYRRALSIDCDQIGYARHWKIVYEWLHEKMTTACCYAACNMIAALGKQDDSWGKA